MSSPIDPSQIPGWTAPPPPIRWFTLGTHGDLDAIAQLHLAAKRANQPQWHELADRLALHVLEHTLDPLQALRAVEALSPQPTPWAHLIKLIEALEQATSPQFEFARTRIERLLGDTTHTPLLETPVEWWQHAARGQLATHHALPHWTLRGHIAQRLTAICSVAPSFTATSLLVEPEGLDDQNAFQQALIQWLTAPQWPHLKHLTLRRCRLWDTGLRALGRSPLMSQLTTFKLERQRVTTTGLSALLSHRQLGALQTLSMRDCMLQADTIAALAQTQPFQDPSALQSLDLSQNDQLGARGLAALARRTEPGIAQLSHLSLEGCRLITEGAITLFDSRRFGALKTLNLSDNLLATGAVLAMTRQRTMTPSRLYVALNQLTNPALTALGHWSGAEKLHHLDLRTNRFGPQSLANLADSRHLNALQTLELDHNPILDAGLHAIAGRPHLKSLRHLSLNACGLQGHGLQGLATFAIERPLETLRLATPPNNPLAPAFPGPPHPNNLSSEACRILATTSAFTHRLRLLDLSGNPIGDQGLVRLGQATRTWRQLETLSLRRCQLQDSGLTQLLASQRFPRLRVLDLRGNPDLPGHTLVEALLSNPLPYLRRVLVDPDTLHPEQQYRLATSDLLPAGLRYTFHDWDHRGFGTRF